MRWTILLLVTFAAVQVSWADDDTLRDLGTNAAPGEIPKWDGAQWRNAHDNVTTVNVGPGLAGSMTNNQITLTVLYLPPIGSVVAWLKSFTNTPALPAGWVECNGQALSDTNSPYDGQTLPNLNGFGGTTNRFLRGSTTSGETGGENTHVLTISEMPGHSHSITLHSGGFGAPAVQRTVAQNGPPSTSTDGSGGDQPHENRPPFYEVVWIMRVK